MARKKKQGESKKAPSPELQLASIPISLDRIGLRHLSYAERPTEGQVQPLTLGDRLDVKSQMEVKVHIFPAGFELYIDMVAAPDPKHLPYEVKVGLSAFFSPAKEISQQEILTFVSGAGVRIMFPYIREVISATSARGLFGPLWLDPLAVSITNLGDTPKS